jgi:hypothetical protein
VSARESGVRCTTILPLTTRAARRESQRAIPIVLCPDEAAIAADAAAAYAHFERREASTWRPPSSGKREVA